MARPGLEPGTPRFSELGAEVSNRAKSLLRSWFVLAGRGRSISAVCGLFGWDWVPHAARVPNGCSDRCSRRLARSESVIAGRTRVLAMTPSEAPVAACARR
jgi:hypothetical protein